MSHVHICQQTVQQLSHLTNKYLRVAVVFLCLRHKKTAIDTKDKQLKLNKRQFKQITSTQQNTKVKDNAVMKLIKRCASNSSTSCVAVPLPVGGPAVASPDHPGPRPLHAAQLPGNNNNISSLQPMSQEACRSSAPAAASKPALCFLQGAVSSSLTCLQLHKRAERVAALLMERGGLQEGDHVALVYPPGLCNSLTSAGLPLFAK